MGGVGSVKRKLPHPYYNLKEGGVQAMRGTSVEMRGIVKNSAR